MLATLYFLYLNDPVSEAISIKWIYVKISITENFTNSEILKKSGCTINFSD